MTIAHQLRPGRLAGAAQSPATASTTASTSAAADYKQGWVDYRAHLFPIPATALPFATTYETSLLVLKAHEDKDNPGAFVASPSMPWGWGELKIDPDNPRSAPYHLVWARDLYQIATALLAAGDKNSAPTARSTSCSPSSSATTARSRRTPRSTASPSGRASRWTSRACRSCSPSSSAALATDWKHVRKAADFIVKEGPKTDQERWENQDGYSPGTIAAEIAGLVCAADIARKNGATAKAKAYEAKADEWQRNVERWTATRNGPYSERRTTCG